MRWFAGLGIAVLCLGSLVFAASDETKHKPKKPALPPLPSGPTGKQVPQIPLDAIAPVPPEVSFQSGQLTIVAPNSTLADILKAVHKQTGAEIEVPSATDRVVTRLGPGPALDVMAELLNGSRFNYVLLGSPEDPNVLTKVVLVAKSGPEVSPAATPPPQPAQARVQPSNPATVPAADASTDPAPDASEAETTEEPADANAPEQPADAEQQAAPADQNPKTPQQLLQEMQQRQLQIQQQQGQAPVPGQGAPQTPPQNPPQQQ
jgi:hypothetical protein